MRSSLLNFGEPAPWFTVPSTANPAFHFHSVGGLYVVLCFFESAARDDSRRILEGFLQSRAAFDDRNACFFGVSTDPDDERLKRAQDYIPGMRMFWDFDRKVSELYGAATADEYRAHTVLIDPLLRVVATIPFDLSPQQHVARILDALKALPRIGPPFVGAPQAPVLVLPRIFEPALCRDLIAYYEQHGGEDSGFMNEKDGMTIHRIDYSHKRRRDREITDERLRNACIYRIHNRLAPEVLKAFQFGATRIERSIVACYDAAEAAHFRAHRDNTTKGTAHRRFAVSLHLNSGEYEGGFLRFPEFGPQQYTAPAGGAIVFSCSLLHEAMPVTRGKRYMYLPFLYDEQAANVRANNLQYIVDR